MIEDKVFYLYRADFCAAATEELDGAVTVTAAGGLAGGVFSKKPSALLIAGVDPKETMPRCQQAACRMVIPNTSARIHAWVIQSKSKKKKGSGAATGGSTTKRQGRTASSLSTPRRKSRAKGKGPTTARSDSQEEESHPAQRRVPQAVNSRVPVGPWAHIWKAHLSWLAVADGYSSWCSICHEGGAVLLCDEEGCGAVQHAECSMQSDPDARHWRCDDCWLMAGERPREARRRIGQGASEWGDCRAEPSSAKRRRMSTTDRLGWVTGARVLDACGVEHVIQAMQHGYVQCSRPGQSELRNYRRRELQLLLAMSDGGGSHSSTSEEEVEDPRDDGTSDHGDGQDEEDTEDEEL